MHVTVFGATGGTGQQLTRQALAAGHQVTAVVRSPDRLPLHHEQLTVITAQVTEDEPELLRSAVRGSDAVFSALGPPGRKPSRVASAGMAHILRAMREADVRRLLAVSAAPLGPPAEGDSLFARRLVLPLLRRVLRRVRGP